ncbi:MAG: hypothetical protein V1703_02480 [Candidatus Altiarchaeota archaeon]
MKNAILVLTLSLVLLTMGCCCCCGPGGGDDGDWSFINLSTPKGNECTSDLSCNGDEECHNGYCT